MPKGKYKRPAVILTRRNITASDLDWERAVDIGHGNASRGVRTALEYYDKVMTRRRRKGFI